MHLYFNKDCRFSISLFHVLSGLVKCVCKLLKKLPLNRVTRPPCMRWNCHSTLCGPFIFQELYKLHSRFSLTHTFLFIHLSHWDYPFSHHLGQKNIQEIQDKKTLGRDGVYPDRADSGHTQNFNLTLISEKFAYIGHSQDSWEAAQRLLI